MPHINLNLNLTIMQKRLKFAFIALCFGTFAYAQTVPTPKPTDEQAAASTDESAFTFTEAQLGEDDNISQEATVIGSNGNTYASEIGYKWSPVRFRYRAFNQKYNDVYINGNPVKDAESNQFRPIPASAVCRPGGRRRRLLLPGTLFLQSAAWHPSNALYPPIR